MKKNTVIWFVVLVVAVFAAALMMHALLNHHTEPADSSIAPEISEASEPTQAQSETETVEIDKDGKVTAEIGVGDGSIEESDEESEPTPQDEQSSTPETNPQTIPEEPENTKYETFYALSSEQKDEFLNRFENYEAFYHWLIEAQERFKMEHPDIEIGPDGTIDLSELAS